MEHYGKLGGYVGQSPARALDPPGACLEPFGLSLFWSPGFRQACRFNFEKVKGTTASSSKNYSSSSSLFITLSQHSGIGCLPPFLTKVVRLTAALSLLTVATFDSLTFWRAVLRRDELYTPLKGVPNSLWYGSPALFAKILKGRVPPSRLAATLNEVKLRSTIALRSGERSRGVDGFPFGGSWSSWPFNPPRSPSHRRVQCIKGALEIAKKWRARSKRNWVLLMTLSPQGSS